MRRMEKMGVREAAWLQVYKYSEIAAARIMKRKGYYGRRRSPEFSSVVKGLKSNTPKPGLLVCCSEHRSSFFATQEPFLLRDCHGERENLQAVLDAFMASNERPSLSASLRQNGNTSTERHSPG